MILEKLEEQKYFTDTEKVIAEYLLNSKHSLIGMTSSALGKATYTSQTAIVRLYKKLGLPNYRTFLNILIEEIMERKKTQNIDTKRPIDSKMSVDEITDILPQIYFKIISTSNLYLNQNTMQRLYNRLSSAKMIDIYGIGISNTLATQLAFKLQAIGLPCRSFDGINQLYIDNSKQKKETISILITFTGENNQLVHIANQLKKANMYTFALIGKTDSILETVCNEHIVFDPLFYNKLDTLSTVIAAQYIIDIIYLMFISHSQMLEEEA